VFPGRLPRVRGRGSCASCPCAGGNEKRTLGEGHVQLKKYSMISGTEGLNGAKLRRGETCDQKMWGAIPAADLVLYRGNTENAMELFFNLYSENQKELLRVSSE